MGREERLPRDMGVDADGATGATTTVESVGTRILHVDDDEDFIELTSIFLERDNDDFEVVGATSVTAGLEQLREGGIDCIVSDYQMPDMDGLAFFERLAPERSDLPFILFTGRGSEEVASDALSHGVTDYLQKESGTDQFVVLANRIEQAVKNSRSERRLETTRRRFRTLVEESNDAIFVVGPDGDITLATRATEHILGRTPEELVGTNGFEPIHPDDLEVVQEEFGKLLEDPDYRGQADFRYEHADGSWIWVEARGRNLVDNEDVGGIVVYVRDIDDRKEYELELERREQKFQAVFEHAFDAMLIADDDGVYVDANPAACELFGHPYEELLGRSIAEFAPEDYDFEEAWQEFQASNHERGRFPLVRADGERRLVEYAASRNILPHRHLSILRDVTERD